MLFCAEPARPINHIASQHKCLIYALELRQARLLEQDSTGDGGHLAEIGSGFVQDTEIAVHDGANDVPSLLFLQGIGLYKGRFSVGKASNSSCKRIF